ncbi:MAG: alpha/beta fold hydrolase [Azospirillum sp.]|nr:alpha/beta fold hydrolase [Azospirillum sp.]MCA3266402.1 alpha/beta fold hydrolase [Azospirillum sp.]
MPHTAGLWFEAHGTGRPLMLLSGLSGVARGWSAQIAPLSRAFRVIVHDHRGTGRSDPAEGRISVERMADDAIALMDALEIERADFLGHSTGGAMALSLAHRYADRVGHVVVSSAWAAPDPDFLRGFEIRADALRARGKAAYLRLSAEMTFGADWLAANRETFEARLTRDLAEPPDADAILRRIAAICRFDMSTELQKIRAPILVIYAEDDAVVPARATQAIANAVPGARAIRFVGGGHALPLVAAQDYARTVVAFLTNAG